MRVPDAPAADYDAWQAWMMGPVLRALGDCATRHRKTVEAWPASGGLRRDSRCLSAINECLGARAHICHISICILVVASKLVSIVRRRPYAFAIDFLY